MMTDRDIKEQALKDALALLGEHFEAVQILTSYPIDECGTASMYRGLGNWYARTGMAQEFLNQDQAQEQAKQIADRLGEDEDEDED